MRAKGKKRQKFANLFAYIKKKSYLCTLFRGKGVRMGALLHEEKAKHV